MAGANAVLAALVARSNGAGGQHIELALLDAMLHWMWLEVFWNESLPESDPAPTYSEWYEPWDTADGQIAANWVNFEQYKGACQALGKPELADDSRFATRDARLQNADAQRSEFAAILKTMFTDDALSALVNLGYKKSQAEQTLKKVCAEEETENSIEGLIKRSFTVVGFQVYK